MHTFKNQFIVLPNGEDIVDVIVGKLGKTSDINLFRLAVISWTQTKVLGDKAYKEMRQLQRLTKKTQKPKLPNSKNKKTKNCLRRIGVEHLIGRIKIFRVASDRFRLARHI